MSFIRHFIGIILVLSVVTSTAQAEKCHLHLMSEQARSLHLQMVENGPYGLVDFSDISDLEIKELKANLKQLENGNKKISGLKRYSFDSAPDDLGTSSHFLHSVATALFNIAKEALPDEEPRILNYELRWWNENVKSAQVEDWHIDYSKMTAILVLEGAGTEFLGYAPSNSKFDKEEMLSHIKQNFSDQKIQSVGVKQALVFLGNENTSDVRLGYSQSLAAIHRTPKITEDRIILIVRF